MHRVPLPLALLGVLIVTTGCASRRAVSVQPDPQPFRDRAAFIDRRADELIRRGVPKDAALAKASGEWFNELLAADRRADDTQRTGQRLLENQLAQQARGRTAGGP